MKKRNAQIDVARGIAILLVILGHSFYSIENPLNKIILTFHMPLFFVLSGLVAKTDEKKMGGYIAGKLYTILLPQILLGVISYVYYGLFIIIMKGGNLREVDFLYQFWRYWFLEVLFIVEIIFHFVSSIINITKVKKQIIVGVSCLILGLLFRYRLRWPDESPFYINVVPMALFFYLLGFACKDFLIRKLNQIVIVKKIIILIVASSILIVCALCNQSVTMYNNGYGKFLLFMFGALSGIITVWIVADFIQKNCFLKWCGMNSIIIYVWQFVLTQFFKNVIEIVFEKISFGCSDILMTFIVFTVCVLSVVPIAVFSNKFIPELYGRKKC